MTQSREDAPGRAGRRRRPGASARPPSPPPTSRPAGCTGPSRCCWSTRTAGSCCSGGPPSRPGSRCAGPTPAAATRCPASRWPRPPTAGSPRSSASARSTLTEVGVYVYHAEDPATGRVEFEYDHVLRGRRSGPTLPLRPDPDEVAELRWVDPAELVADLDADPRAYAPWLGGVVSRLLRPAAGAGAPGPAVIPSGRRRTTRRSGRVVDEALSAGAVARRLGVAVTTLRTWHQRYGLGPSEHVPGHHRRYTAGRPGPPGDHAPAHRRGGDPGRGGPLGPPGTGGAADDLPAPTPAARRAGTAAARPSRSVGAGPAARGLARAAMRLDSVAIGETIARRPRRRRGRRHLGRACSVRCWSASASGTPPPPA